MEDSFFLDKGIETTDEEVEPPSASFHLAKTPRLNLVPRSLSPSPQVASESPDSMNWEAAASCDPATFRVSSF